MQTASAGVEAPDEVAGGLGGGEVAALQGKLKGQNTARHPTAAPFWLSSITAFFGLASLRFLGGLAFRAHHLFENKS